MLELSDERVGLFALGDGADTSGVLDAAETVSRSRSRVILKGKGGRLTVDRKTERCSCLESIPLIRTAMRSHS